MSNFGTFMIAAHFFCIMSFEIHVTKTQVMCTHELWKIYIFYKSKYYKFVCSGVLWRSGFSLFFSVAQRSLLATSRLHPVKFLEMTTKAETVFRWNSNYGFVFDDVWGLAKLNQLQSPKLAKEHTWLKQKSWEMGQ
jgi:hypothetical protein